MTNEQVHEAGVLRHGTVWAAANQRAVSAITGAGFMEPWDKGVKETVAYVILRVLDGIRIDAGETWAVGIGWVKKP